MRIVSRCVAACVVGLLLAACGEHSSPATPVTTATPTASAPAPGSTASSQPTGSADPCALVTQQDAQAALDRPVQPISNVPVVVPGQRTCGYGSADSAGLVAVLTFPDTGGLFDTLRAQRRQAGRDYRDVAGLGDGAFRDGGQLYVRRGGTVLGIFVNGFDTDERTEAVLRTLAAQALGRM